MAETIQVGTEQRTLGKPQVKHYLNATRLLLDILKRNDTLLEAIARGSESAKDLEDGQSVDARTSVDMLKAFIDFLAELQEEDICRVGAVLLQFKDIDEGVVFIEKAGGVELGWLTEAFAINAETADIGRVVENFRRTVQAVQAQRRALAGKQADPEPILAG